MPNPGRTQAEFTRLLTRLFHGLRKAAILDEVLTRFQGSDTLLEITGEPGGAAALSSMTLAGVDIGSNTYADGRLFVKFTANASNWDISLSKSLADADPVATATNVADDTDDVALAEANSSGITGTVNFGTGYASADDEIQIRLFPALPAMDRIIYDDTEDEDGALRAEQAALNANIVQTLRSLRDRAAASVRAPAMLDYVARVIKSGESGALQPATTTDDGAVTLSVTGLLEALREAMDDNTTEQNLSPTTLAAGSVSYDAGNTGLGTLAVGSIGANFEPGLVTLACVDERMPAERFRVTFRPDDSFAPRIQGANDLTIGKEWNDPRIPISLTLSRTYDKNSTDGSHAIFPNPASTVPSVTGITTSNSDDGTLFLKTTANGSNWDIEFFRSSGRTSADLVAKATNIAASAAFTATQRNRSGLTVGWTLGGTVSASSAVELDANPWKVGPPADVLSFAVTRSALGVAQDAWRKFVGWRLHQGGSVTFTDNAFQRGGPVFRDYT